MNANILKNHNSEAIKKKLLNCKGQLLSLESPLIMGILNVTPDSFFDGNIFTTEKAWLKQTEKMLSEGASIIDIGCISTRPGAILPNLEEELDRLLPVLDSIMKYFPEAILSVDTFRAEVAKAAVNHGAAIINDISGGTMDAAMFETIAVLHIPYILMHIQGTPETMQRNPVYKDIVKETILYLSKKTNELTFLGVNDIIIDPGFGFGKNIKQNFEMMQQLHLYKFLDKPLLVGVSRKSMIWKTLESTPDKALNGTSVLHTISLLAGADILRVHDVREAVECMQILKYFSDKML